MDRLYLIAEAGGERFAIPAEAVRLYGHAENAEWDAALALWQSIYAVNDFIWHNPFNPSVKALGNELGLELGQCRRPVQPLDGEELGRLREAIRDLA